METKTTTNPTIDVWCPWCGGALHIEQTTVDEAMIPGFHYVGAELPRRSRLAMVAFCTGCEFCHEFNAGTAPFLKKEN